MSFEPPAGILDIGNATLRVGKLEVAETSGLNQGLQNIVKNDLLVTENTTYTTNQKWGLKLPTNWVAEFEVKGHSGKYIDFNFYNENSASNAQGYNLTFRDTTMSLRYDGGSPLGGGEVTIPTIVGTFRKVHIFFERNVIAVSIDGTRYLYDKRPSVLSRVISTTGSAFVNLFIEENAANSEFKNLRIVNGRFISDETSNIAFVGGNLGVGVHSPKESLDIRGNMHLTRVSNVSQVKVDSNVVTEYTGPHDRPLRKYPEVALTADAATSSGYKGYKVTSSFHHASLQDWNAFDGVTDATVGWHTANSDSTIRYTGTDGEYNGTNATQLSSSSNTVNGEYLQIELPKAIKLKYYVLYPQGTSGVDQYNSPTRAVLYGSNDGSAWTEVHRYTDAIYDTDKRAGIGYTFHVNSNQSYKYFAIVPTHRDNSTLTADTTGISIGELEFYGYEEGSGSLDTTLKSVYNVPATTGTQLEVYYDAKDLTTMPSTVTDLSPNTNSATLGGNPQVSNGAFVFDGSGDAVISGATSFSGSPTLSYSVWFKTNSILSGTGSNSIVMIGHAASTKSLGLRIKGTGDTNPGNYRFYVYGGATNESVETDIKAQIGIWTHATIVRDGLNMKLYIDGKFVDENTNTTTNLALNSGARVTLGNYIDSNGAVTTISANDSYDGSIANFRLYSKALNADQVKELYDYQKDYFLGSKSQVTLYKGHLGVGVTEPSGQLELAGDERIQEYPPRGMTGYETLMEGHGVFCASASSYYNATQHLPWQAFTPAATSGTADGWNSGDNSTGSNLGYYAETASGEATSAAALFEGTRGEWVQLKCPYPIIVKKFAITGRSNGVYGGSPEDQPKSGILYGSNDGNNWDILANFSGLTYGGASGGAGATGGTEIVEVNATKGYTRLVLQATARVTNYGTNDWINIGQLQYFGTPGPTTLDKGSLSLTRSLDVPRVSRYDVDTETPRPEKLVLDLDTTVNRYPIDISGKFNDGVFNGSASYSPADKAFVFDGDSDYIQGTLNVNGSELDTSYTLSVWVKSDSTANDNAVFMFIGSSGTGDSIGFRHHNNSSTGGTEYRIYHFGVKDTSATGQSSNLNQWRHLVAVYDGTNQNIYVDGVFAVKDAASSLGLPNNPTYSIGYRWDGGTATEYFDGMISNPKVYNVALEPSEVKKLYNLGRTGRSMVISDTAVGIGKTPEAQLDVRGVTRFDGRVGIGTNVPHFALHIHGNDKYVQAVYHSQWINWLTNPNYNNVYNGDSPNYPHTTHPASNETGVYSRRSIGCSGYLWSAGNVLNMSDRRIKTNIIDANDDICLRTLRQLKPKKYNYKDVRERGSEPVWGFIAQEVKETIPYSTTFKTEYVPNIQEKARLLDDGKTIVFTDFNTASLESNATTIRIMDKNEKEYDVTLSEILDPYTIRIKEDITGHSFTYDQPDDNGNVLEGNYVYVHGQKVDDFVYLRKDAIWTVTTAALQEVDRQLQFERARNDALEARVAALEQAKYM